MTVSTSSAARAVIIEKARKLIDGEITWDVVDLHVEELIAVLLSEIAWLEQENTALRAVTPIAAGYLDALHKR